MLEHASIGISATRATTMFFLGAVGSSSPRQIVHQPSIGWQPQYGNHRTSGPMWPAGLSTRKRSVSNTEAEAESDDSKS
jgi:hypothetical protein